MKTISSPSLRKSALFKIPFIKQRSYWAAIGLASLACGGTAVAQTNSVPSTNSPVSDTSTNATVMEQTTVVGKLNQARSSIVTSVGATQYSMSQEQIAAIPQGSAAPFNQVLLRAPGIAEDSLGQVHLRGEHANIQYRINDVLLPEGITGFGSEIDTRFVRSMNLITGSLPAEYGFRTAGIVDIQTKSGAFDQGGEASIYGGSYNTISPSFEYGGSEGKLNYFFNGSYLHDSIGIENPAPTATPIHDVTDQYKGFMYLSYLLDDTSRISLIGSAYDGNFQIPIDPNLQPTSTQANGNPWVPGTFSPNQLNDNQNEQGYYAVAAYQKTAGDLSFQVAGFGRESSAYYVTDATEPTLFFNSGVASDVKRLLYSGGLQADSSYNLNDNHTLRGGASFLEEYVSADNSTTVFPVDAAGNASGPAQSIPLNTVSRAQFYDIYLQDEWKLLPRLTINFGGRFDVYSSSTDHENQFCPRINGVFKATDSTTLHAGYAHYFTPPPLENVPPGSTAAFAGTTGEPAITESTPVKAERADYFDAGITQTILPGWQVGVDGYYKTAKNQLDDGFFGQSLILSSFNYAKGRIHGVEFTTSYTTNNWSVYANVAWANAQGKGAASAQFFWPDTTTLNYVNQHWIALDHDQRLTGSFGASYLWQETEMMSTRPYIDALYGSGLRQDGGEIDSTGVPIPNGGTVPNYYTVSVGAEQDFKLSAKKHLKARIDVVNVTDHIYQLRSGSGVGVNAAQFGERRGFFGTLSFVF
jgi:outer membrane receptor protein involved in Fe transport